MMENKPQLASSADVQPVANQKEIIFNGQIGSFVAHADTQQTNYFFGGLSLPSNAETLDFGAPPQMDFNFYNLFVITSEYINGQTFSVPKELALQDTDGDVIAALLVLIKTKSMPSGASQQLLLKRINAAVQLEKVKRRDTDFLTESLYRRTVFSLASSSCRISSSLFCYRTLGISV